MKPPTQPDRTMKIIALFLLTLLGAAASQAGQFIQTDYFSIAADRTNSLSFEKFGGLFNPPWVLQSVTIQFTPQLSVVDTLNNNSGGAQNFNIEIASTASFWDASLVAVGAVTLPLGPVSYSLANGASQTLNSNSPAASYTLASSNQPALLALFNGAGIINLFASTFTVSKITGGVALNPNNAAINGTLAVIYDYAWPPPSPTGIGAYSNLPVVYYPTTTGNSNYVLQMSTNLATTNWVTVSNYVPMTAIMVTNALPNAFFRLH